MKAEYNQVWSRLGLPIVLLVALGFCTPLAAQVCSTGGPVTLSSQAQVASFQADYGAPTCDTMSDDLTVSGADITDLSPLGLTTMITPARFVIDGNTSLVTLDGLSLTSVYWLQVSNNPAVTSINGLSTVVSAGGPVIIRNNALLTNVNGLSGLSSLPGGALQLADNTSLADLGGVSGITSTGGSLVIQNNAALTNLNALTNLTGVNGLVIMDNAALASISGLSSLTSTGATGSVNIRNNPNLASLTGLSGLTSVGGLVISNNDALTDLDPLIGITSVGNSTSLALLNNDSLVDITGLANVEGVGFQVEISGNTSLSQCSILARLLDQVDDFAPGPGPGVAGIPDVGDDVIIGGNLSGCNSVPEIVGAPPPPPPPGMQSVAVPALASWTRLALVLMILGAGLIGFRREL
ncbi:MAG: hypothetical protein WCD36_05205 [Rhodanobacteraceae bacterium]